MRNSIFSFSASLKKIISCLFAATFVFIISCKKDPKSQDETPVTPSNQAVLTAKRGNDAGIYDREGRFVILRGVNYNVLGDYWHANPSIPATAQHHEEQFRIMASYGFNCIRLLFSWSALEPERGQHNQAYIQNLARVIEDAKKYGIYVMLDLHQDAYSKYIFSTPEDNCERNQKGWDGAPLWATYTDGQSVCSNDGSREGVPAVYYAWQNLWDNRDGIQDNLIASWKVLIAALGHHENVIGYDLINEPSLGYSSLQDQQKKLSGFYSRLIKAIRETEKQHQQTEKIAFFEPAVTHAGQQIPAVVGANFTADQNIVFAPHNYFEVITQLLTVEQGFTLYNTLAQSYQTACFIGEWGVYSEPSVGKDKMKRFAQQEDHYRMGSTFWQWCQAPGDPHGISWDGQTYDQTSLHLMELDAQGNYTGKRNDIFLQILGRTRPIVIQGKNIKYTSDPDSGTFFLKARAAKKGITELWIPNFFGQPEISGKNIAVKNLKEVDGGYIAEIEVEADYEINITH